MGETSFGVGATGCRAQEHRARREVDGERTVRRPLILRPEPHEDTAAPAAGGGNLA